MSRRSDSRRSAARFLRLESLEERCMLAFSHPGLLHTEDDFERVSDKVAAQAEPWLSGWQALVSNGYAQPDTDPRPLETVIRGATGQNFNQMVIDIQRAYMLALRWKVSGDTVCADKAVEFLNAWQYTMATLTGNADRFLAAGIYGYQWANVAEIMHTYEGWSAADAQNFGNWLVQHYYSLNHELLTNHNNAAITHCWANWDLCNIASMLAIGVYTDNQTMYDEAVGYFYNGGGNGAGDKFVYYVHDDNPGQWQELPIQLCLSDLLLRGAPPWRKGISMIDRHDQSVTAMVGSTAARRSRRSGLIGRLPERLGVRLAALLAASVVTTACPGQDLTGDLDIHDPSTVMVENGRYYVYATGPGISAKTSSDRVDWQNERSVFGGRIPSWTFDHVPGFDGRFWAPDIAYFNGLYHLYYSVSSWGSQDSAIGLATTPTLDRNDPSYGWTDQGPVIESNPGAGDPYNAIDPAILQTSGGELWMSFGSFWNGIYMTQLDPATGRRITPDSPTYQVANKNQIEASYLYEKDDYYYLFVNWGTCCQGAASTYNIRVGRGTSVTGPFYDKNGNNMRFGGGSLFLGTEGDFIGPGHISIFSDQGSKWFGYHYYPASGDPWSAYNIRALSWDEDGWPVAGPSTPPSLPGDFNGNGIVDAADYTVWRDGLASGAYTEADYTLWKLHFGQTAGAGAAVGLVTDAAPEGASLLLALLAWLSVLSRVPGRRTART